MHRLAIAVGVAAAMMMLAFSLASSGYAAAGAGIGKLTLPAPYSKAEPAACRGPGAHCPPGRHWVCGPDGHRCWCAPC